MKLHTLRPDPGATKGRKRIGRGPGSGSGKTSGKGTKGQKSREGYKYRPWFEGGQMPIQRRLPARGFKNPCRKTVANVNVGDLARVFAAESDVTVAALVEKGLLKGRFDLVKILGDGALSHRLVVTAHRFSETARRKITAAGGEAVEVAA